MSFGTIRGASSFTSVKVLTASGDWTVTHEATVVVNKTSGAATAVNLPTGISGLPGRTVTVVDGKGDAATNNITVTRAGSQTINGATTYVVSENYGSVTVRWNGTEWNVISLAAPLSATELGFLNGVTAGTSAASKALVLDSNSELNGIGVIRKADVLIATAAVLTLSTTPVDVVAAPAADTYIEFLGAYVFLDYNSAAYAADAGEDLCIRYTDGSGDIVSTDIDGEEFEATADALFVMSPVPTAPNIITHPAATKLVAHVKVGNWATGNSPLKIRTYYRTIRKAALEAIA